ncbi:hypothetical protein TUBRATIS_24210 [Tubulinosema ratisbonensis]|uniref:Uncharacterized protein n=1 Tax=Tubulinosema ratisbonensis TaxID=291195 RepID=A0A437AJ67_9MICR|nr:hypothetical protein TUBRATIS_24210 [Tubulinosema ratisbonensis]
MHIFTFIVLFCINVLLKKEKNFEIRSFYKAYIKNNRNIVLKQDLKKLENFYSTKEDLYSNLLQKFIFMQGIYNKFVSKVRPIKNVSNLDPQRVICYFSAVILYDFYSNYLIYTNVFANKISQKSVKFSSLYRYLLSKKRITIRESCFLFLSKFIQEYLEEINIINVPNNDLNNLFKKELDAFLKNHDMFFIYNIDYTLNYQKKELEKIFNDKIISYFNFLIRKIIISSEYQELLILFPEQRIFLTFLKHETKDFVILKKIHYFITFVLTKCNLILNFLIGESKLENLKHIPIYKSFILVKLQYKIRCLFCLLILKHQIFENQKDIKYKIRGLCCVSFFRMKNAKLFLDEKKILKYFTLKNLEKNNHIPLFLND